MVAKVVQSAAALWLLAPGLFLSPMALAAPIPVGGEFQINSYTTGAQKDPSVAVGSNGFLVVWTSDGSGGSDTDAESIQGQRFSFSGTKIGSEFQVNAYTPGPQTRASVDLFSDDSFVVVWTDGYFTVDSGDGSRDRVQGRRFASNGNPIGSEFQINSWTTYGQATPAVIAFPNRQFVVVWDSLGSSGTDASNTSIQGQRFASDGTPLDGEFQVNSYTTGYQLQPSVAGGPDGSFVVVWESGRWGTGPDGDAISTQAQRYASDGSPVGGEFQVNTYTSGYQGNPSVASDSEGDFVVVWQSSGSMYGSFDSILGQRYASNGLPQGGEFQISLYTTNTQRRASVARDSDGKFVVAWNSWFASSGNDNSFYSIQGRHFATDATAIGSDLQVNTYTTQSQNISSVGMTPGGDFVIVWDSLGSDNPDTSEESIQGQRFAELAFSTQQIFADGFESGTVCGWSGSSVAYDCPPSSPLVALLAATDQDEITLAWAPASDDNTPAADLVYNIYVSQSADFVPDAGTLAAAVFGITEHTLTGLNSDTPYHLLVLAEDNQGQESLLWRYREISTAAVPPVASGVALQTTEGLGLGIPILVTPEALTFSRGPQAEPPDVAAILVGKLSDGRGFLRRVDSVTTSATEIGVQTSETSIEEAVDQLHLLSSGLLLDVSNPTKSLLGESAPAGLEVTHTRRPDGSHLSRLRWADRLVVEQVEHAGEGPTFAYRPDDASGHYRVEIKDRASAGLMLMDLNVDFQPEFVTSARWGLFSGLQEAELIARGTLDFSVGAQYTFSGAASVTQGPFSLLTRTWTAFYLVGQVPVYQQITLDVQVEASATAMTEIAASASALASAAVEVGARYDRVNGWQPIASIETRRDASADLSITGSIDAQVRLVPTLSIEFYEVLTGRISLEASLSAGIRAEGTAVPDCFPLELTEFHIGLGLACQAGVYLTIFGEVPLFEEPVCNLAPWPLWSLPQLALTAHGVNLEATVTNGANNWFDGSSILWRATPAPAFISSSESAPRSAVVECNGLDGTATVTFSGYGRLGEAARRCEQADVDCGAGWILIDKETDPAEAPENFSFTLAGGPSGIARSFNLSDESAPYESGPLPAGSGYRASEEVVPPGWMLTSATCSDGSPVGNIDLSPGETVTCTFTNASSRIIIDKVTYQPGYTTSFDFTLKGGPSGIDRSFSLTDEQKPYDSGPLVPGGGYVASEEELPDWLPTSATCSGGSPVDNIVLSPGETVTCTFNNTPIIPD